MLIQKEFTPDSKVQSGYLAILCILVVYNLSELDLDVVCHFANLARCDGKNKQVLQS